MGLLLKTKMSLIQKICLAGLFIALTTICQKVIAINYINVIPFVRVSFGGSALLMFSSYLLGPWFGLLVGAASDVLGYFIFDMSGMAFFPQLTLTSALLGFVPYFIFSFVRLVKNKRLIQFIEYIVFFILFLTVTLVFELNSSITLFKTTYQITKTIKILVPILLFILFLILAIITIVLDKKSKRLQQNILNTYQISFSCLIIELFVIVLFGSLMKATAFGFQTFFIILICQIITSFINMPINTFLLSYIMYLTKRYIE